MFWGNLASSQEHLSWIADGQYGTTNCVCVCVAGRVLCFVVSNETNRRTTHYLQTCATFWRLRMGSNFLGCLTYRDGPAGIRTGGNRLRQKYSGLPKHSGLADPPSSLSSSCSRYCSFPPKGNLSLLDIFFLTFARGSLKSQWIGRGGISIYRPCHVSGLRLPDFQAAFGAASCWSPCCRPASLACCWYSW